ncbi:MAG: PKD domain-containing protein, partial [Thermoplasmata archaeon]|nr:PKD domain-containing protein [Thermoplasmata archaeon]
EPIEFSSASSFDPDEDHITFRWISSEQGELSTSDSFVKNLIEGEHLITLEITDDFGSRNTTQISITVKPFLPYLEIREFYLDKENAVEKDKVTVNAVVYNEGEATSSPAIVEFLVNDEVVDSVEQPLDVGNRIITTFIWIAEGEKSFLSVRTRPGHDAGIDEVKVGTVNVSANTPPVIVFDVYPSIIVVDEAVNFINNGTDDANGDTLTYQWEFGDGATSSDVSTQHLYAFKGTYVVKLTVTDTRDGQTIKEWTILVEEVPEDDSSSLSMAMIGGIAVAIIVILLIVVFLMRGRGKEPSPGTDPVPSYDQDTRPRPPPPPGYDTGHAPVYDPTPPAEHDPSPTPEEEPGPATEYDPSPAAEEVPEVDIGTEEEPPQEM